MKKIICAVLVAVMLASLCACGGDFVGGGDTFTVDRARIRDAWAATGSSYTHTEYKTIDSYIIVKCTDLVVMDVYESSGYKSDVDVDLSEYTKGAYIVQRKEMQKGEEIDFTAHMTINSTKYHVKFTGTVDQTMEEYRITVKDLDECYEIVYYYLDDAFGNYNYPYVYADENEIKDMASRHSIITAKENVILYTDLD